MSGFLMRQVAAALCFGAIGLIAPSAEAHGPIIAPQFTTTIDINGLGLGVHFAGLGGPVPPTPAHNFSSLNGTLIYDVHSKRWRISSESVFDFFGPDAVSHRDIFAAGNKSYKQTNGQCYDGAAGPPSIGVATDGFDSLFGWTKDSKVAGHVVVGNLTCVLWRGGNNTICMYGDSPIYMETTSFAPAGPFLHGVMHITFGQPLNRHINASELDVPEYCTRPPSACGRAEVKRMDFFVLHPKGQFNISGQDVADVKGDAVFLCLGQKIWDIEQYKLASRYEISIFEQYGQYAPCNFYPPVCFGGDNFHVGRETPVSIGRHGGQCDDDADWRQRIGSWYSLPSGGECTGSRQQLGKDCTWRIERRVKTVEMACMFDKQHNLLGACPSAKPPFESIEAAYLKIFTSDDPAEGGCPPVQPPGAIPSEVAEIVV